MTAAETLDGSARRSDAANDDAPAPEAWEGRVAGLKQRVMARITRSIEQAAGRLPPVPHGRRRPSPQRIDRPTSRQREAIVQPTGEVLIVTSSYRFRAFDGLIPEELDGHLPFAPARTDPAGRSGSLDDPGVREPAGPAPTPLGAGAAALSAGRPASPELAAATAGSGEGLAAWTVEIVLAYLAKNTIDPIDLPRLISDLNKTLWQISEKDVPSKDGSRPAVPIAKSVMPDYIICLEDGRRFKSMKRHLKATYNLTPEEYRDKWGLPESYPMIAPNYARQCSERAKVQKLGKRRSGG
ncbi:MucR family transcriptional regulator [Inquilinus sp. Marseille-Q2685]|uniref:MucR family transcriptional regulator n=1 Tax=Inquilinus sp. Marseille-Q2685 TaxID=2866581 RepID=UPI0027DECB36|nr:MucR family transcriptional regulator [Inquilinus sp. Marseille-Q2685]